MSRLREIYPANYYSFTTRGANGAGRAKVVYRVKNWLDRRWFRSMTRSIPGASLAALDVGGGTGEQLDALKAADARVSRTVIVDLDEQADSAARARGHEYVRARIEDAQLRGPFDVILLLNLIEHVADPLSVLQKVRSLLSPRGVVLVVRRVEKIGAVALVEINDSGQFRAVDSERWTARRTVAVHAGRTVLDGQRDRVACGPLAPSRDPRSSDLDPSAVRTRCCRVCGV